MTNQGKSTEVQEAIVAADENFMEAFKRGDAAALADLYTENGQLLPTGSDFVTVKAAIQAFWQGAMDMGIKSAKKTDKLTATYHFPMASHFNCTPIFGSLQNRVIFKSYHHRFR